MAIKEYEFFHGAALFRLATVCRDGLKVRRLEDVGSGCYEVNDSVGVLIKYSAKRMTPWSFSFTKAHKASLSKLAQLYKNSVVLLVCNDDGIVALNVDATMSMLSPDFFEQWSVAADRKPRAMYSVSGTGGELPGKFADSEFARRLFSDSELT